MQTKEGLDIFVAQKKDELEFLKTELVGLKPELSTDLSDENNLKKDK